MKIHIITAFPNFFNNPLDESILKRAQNKKLIDISVLDLRKFATDKHHQIDDTPYGGGPGMILKTEPIFLCIEHIIENISKQETYKIIFLTPQGKQYKQNDVKKLLKIDNLVLLCGHYKGIDERIRDYWKMDEISIGDYVLTGGEIPALVIIDSVTRLIPGTISDINSATTDSFYNDLLDCSYYTRPETYKNMQVPAVLLSGNHAEINKWRKRESVKRTIRNRSDLISEKRLQELKNDEDLGGLFNE